MWWCGKMRGGFGIYSGGEDGLNGNPNKFNN